MLLSNPFRPDTRVLKEANSLALQGFTVTVIAWDRQAQGQAEERLPSGVRILRVQNVRSTYGVGAGQLKHLPRFWMACWRRLPDLQPDLVYCHDFDTLPAGLAWALPRRIPVVYDAHEYYADLVKPRLSGLTGRLLYRWIATAERAGARLASAVVTVDLPLSKIYQQLNRRVLVVGHYPPREFCPQPADVFARPTLNLLYAGRISADRGLLVVGRVLKELLARGVPAQLTLAGVFTPQSEASLLAENLPEISSNVHFAGWVPFEQMPTLLQQADLGLALLLPESRYVAALPVKLFEYMAAGLPVLASDFPAIRSVVEKSGCGLLADPLSPPAEIAEKIIQWWQNPEAARQAGRQGRQAFIDEYNFESQAGRLSSLVSELIHP